MRIARTVGFQLGERLCAVELEVFRSLGCREADEMKILGGDADGRRSTSSIYYYSPSGFDLCLRGRGHDIGAVG